VSICMYIDVPVVYKKIQHIELHLFGLNSAVSALRSLK
jgi:hypothetical protein